MLALLSITAEGGTEDEVLTLRTPRELLFLGVTPALYSQLRAQLGKSLTLRGQRFRRTGVPTPASPGRLKQTVESAVFDVVAVQAAQVQVGCWHRGVEGVAGSLASPGGHVPGRRAGPGQA